MQVHVAFRDGSEEEVIAIFTDEQDYDFWPFQGLISDNDKRCVTFESSLVACDI